MTTDASPQTPATGNYADVNGIDLYYNMAESPLVAATILDVLDAT